MSKVVFSIQYEIASEKREEYIIAIRELKSLVKAEGLEYYNVFEVKGKQNLFEELFVFANTDSFDNYDDSENERVAILLSKIEELKIQNTTKYHTAYSVIE